MKGSKALDNGNIAFPAQVSLDANGNIFVADVTNNRIQEFNSAGVPQFHFGLYGATNGRFQAPESVVTTSDDSIFVSDDTERLQKINAADTYQTQFSVGKLSSLTVDSHDYIYGVNRLTSQIVKLDTSGNILLTFGTLGTGP